MKRTLRAYMEFQLETQQNEKELIPSVGGYGVVIDEKKFLPFDFEDMHGTVKREGDVLKFSTEQRNLDFETYHEYWIENGFISENPNDEDIEDTIFNLIKESTGVSEIYLDIFTGEGDNFFEDKIIMTSFVVVDIVNNEVINVLDKPMHKEAVFDNIEIRCEEQEMIS